MGSLQDDLSTIDGLRVFARRRAASATPALEMLLLPGLGLSGRYLVPTLLALPGEVDAFAVDPPGFGASGKPGQTLDIRSLAAVLAGWLDAHGLRRPLVFGNSFGSQLAVELALQAPARVSALVLGAPTPVASRRSYLVHGVRLLEAAWKAPPELRRIALRDYADAGLRRLALTGRYALEDPIRAKLTRIEHPTLVLHGRDDPVARSRWASEVAGLLPAGTLAVVPGAAHAAVFSAAAKVARILAEFARATADPASASRRRRG